MASVKRGGPRLRSPISGNSGGVLGKKKGVRLPMEGKSYAVDEICRDNIASLQPAKTKQMGIGRVGR